MSRVWFLILHTLREAVVQPVYPLLLAVGFVVLGVYGRLPFFTLGEDVLMYKSVSLDVVLLLVLVVSLFAASRSVFEEIEDRTMLTLMSKPVTRAEVLAGKFLGIWIAAGVGTLVLGAWLALNLWLRIPGDYNLPPRSIDDGVVARLAELRATHLAGLWPQLTLLWMQVGVLIAVSVTISTRFSLLVNLPVTILVYLAGNLTRFLPDAGGAGGWAAWAVTLLLPYLSVFDLTDQTVFGTIAVGDVPADAPGVVTVADLWIYVGIAAVYFVAFTTFVLAVGYASLRRRDLSGSEG